MSEHISAGNWLRFLDHAMPAGEERSVLLHIASCAECRAFMARARDLRWALEREAALAGQAGEDDEFRAVAGPGAAAPAAQAGFLRVEIVSAGGTPVFRDASLAASGIGNKYAMNLSPDGQEFADDEGLLVLSLRAGTLRVECADPGVRASARLLGPEGASAPPEPEPAEIPLPAGGFPRVLEIIFRK